LRGQSYMAKPTTNNGISTYLKYMSPVFFLSERC
jgi:hypothetical protein